MSRAGGIAVPARYPLHGVLMSAATYESTSASVLAAARGRQSLLVAATSAHGVTLGARDRAFRAELNGFDILTPDGQPVRWALNLLHHTGLSERVYGPTLMLEICRAAAREQRSIYLYGGRSEVLARLAERLVALVPGLRIAGCKSPPFDREFHDDDEEDARAIRASGAEIVFVALGCPRQEHWAYVNRHRLPMPIVCVGAAFDFHAGVLPQAPPWMQARGLEWLFRLTVEPGRLWRRYATIVPLFLVLLTGQYASHHLGRRLLRH